MTTRKKIAWLIVAGVLFWLISGASLWGAVETGYTHQEMQFRLYMRLFLVWGGICFTAAVYLHNDDYLCNDKTTNKKVKL